jgi:hypothetical protein
MDDNKVAVLLEDLRAQFRTFGEGLQLLNDKVDRIETKVDTIDQKLDTHIAENRRDFEKNHQEHQQLMQMVKELDTEVIQIKRVK